MASFAGSLDTEGRTAVVDFLVSKGELGLLPHLPLPTCGTMPHYFACP